MVQYSTNTSVMWKLEASSAQTLRMNFTVKEETSGVQQENFRNQQYLHIQRFWIFNEGEGGDV